MLNDSVSNVERSTGTCMQLVTRLTRLDSTDSRRSALGLLAVLRPALAQFFGTEQSGATFFFRSSDHYCRQRTKQNTTKEL